MGHGLLLVDVERRIALLDSSVEIERRVSNLIGRQKPPAIGIFKVTGMILKGARRTMIKRIL
jgi:hypothetical protein